MLLYQKVLIIRYSYQEFLTICYIHQKVLIIHYRYEEFLILRCRHQSLHNRLLYQEVLIIRYIHISRTLDLTMSFNVVKLVEIHLKFIVDGPQ